MSVVQHRGAEELLQLIRHEYGEGPDTQLTYTTAAERIGRNKDHAKAVAQMCDLLDAAAAYSRTPLLALVAIRSAGGDLNPNAWAKEVDGPTRQAILNNSLSHRFTPQDYDAISDGLTALSGLGGTAAWDAVKDDIPWATLLTHLTGTAATTMSSENGSVTYADLELVEGGIRLRAHLRRERAPRLVAAKKREARTEGKGLLCEACNASSLEMYPGLVTDPWEVHHRKPLFELRDPRPTRLLDLAILCPSCHRAIHRTKPLLSVEDFSKKFFDHLRKPSRPQPASS